MAGILLSGARAGNTRELLDEVKDKRKNQTIEVGVPDRISCGEICSSLTWSDLGNSSV